MLDLAAKATEDFVSEMPKTERKYYGQFFTDSSTASYMADLFTLSPNKKSISILDAGAGSGMLSVALLVKLSNVKWLESIHLTCYESDKRILPILNINLHRAAQLLTIPVSVDIIDENYITSQQKNDSADEVIYKQYDLVIGNPPYKKISKDAPEALCIPKVCHGAPNLYFLFATMGIENLKPDGEMVYIIPRSWTSGAYFSAFRKYFLSKVVLEHIHLFKSRNKVFEKENVLQETMIIKVRKTSVQPDTISVSVSESSRDFTSSHKYSARYNDIVCGKNKYVYLITNKKEADIVRRLNHWKNNLPSLGLKMRTGLTVNYRETDNLRNTPDANTVPLFYPQHIKAGKVLFPVGRDNEYVIRTASRLCQKNINYLFVKRFTSKEEHRRLQCGVYLACKYPNTHTISTQNKLNFIDGLKDLSDCIVFGLYVLFNSTVYDQYYRILNGSTQVNSTEINCMPVPELAIIEAMGKDFLRYKDYSEEACNNILSNYL